MNTKYALILFLLFAMPAYASENGLHSPVLPHHVYDMSTGEIIDFEELLTRCAGSDVVAFGEHHGDPATDLIELAILQGLDRLMDGRVELSMEMFERDVQPVVDSYIQKEIDEDELLANARPPSTYMRDYRRLINYCRRNGIPVVAANIPTYMAIQIAINGYDAALMEFTDEEKGWLPDEYTVEGGEYQTRHAETIRSSGVHGMGMEMTDELVYKYFQAQSLKDDTMAESIAEASASYRDSVVYQIVGSFHIEGKLGMFEKIVRRMPGDKVISILAIPVEDLSISPDEISHPLGGGIPECDYLILVPDYSQE